MADEELIASGLEVLEDLVAMLMEEAHEAAVTATPEAADLRVDRVRQLRQAGADIMVLADACEVLLRRAGSPPLSAEGGSALP